MIWQAFQALKPVLPCSALPLTLLHAPTRGVLRRVCGPLARHAFDIRSSHGQQDTYT